MAKKKTETVEQKVIKHKLPIKTTRKERKKSSGGIVKPKEILICYTLPTSADQCSSNWKKLTETLNKTDTVKPVDTHKPIWKNNSQQRKRKLKANKSLQTSKHVIPKYRSSQKPRTLNPPSQLPPDCSDSEPEVWFDDDEDDLLVTSLKERQVKKWKTAAATHGKVNEHQLSSSKEEDVEKNLVKSGSFQGTTKAISIDCEMVGVGEGGVDSILARVSIVNHGGTVVYDKYVQPTEKVTDYRTHVSGIRPEDIKNGEMFKTVQKEVSEFLKGRILVGHALSNDLKVLLLTHPRHMIRDTSRYREFRSMFQGRTPSLKKLTEVALGVKVQQGEHNSVQDAQAAMRLYTMFRTKWEREIRDRRGKKHEKVKKTTKKAT